MRATLYILLLLISSNSLYASLPDSILIKDFASYLFPVPAVNHTKYSIVKKSNNYVVYQTYSFVHNRKITEKNHIRTEVKKLSLKSIEGFINLLEDTNYIEPKLIYFGISKEIVENNSDIHFEFIEDNYHYWKDFQVDYVKKELCQFGHFQNAFDSLYAKYNYQEKSQKFNILIYKDGDLEKEISPSLATFGLPWKINSKKNYNPQIGITISKFFPKNAYPKSIHLNGTTESLLNILTNQIYDEKCKKIVDILAVQEFDEELSELEPEFQIIEKAEYSNHGRYVDIKNQNEPLIRIVLKNKKMFQNMELRYFISKQGNSLYPRDSLINDYPYMIDKVKEISFLMEYLKSDSTSKLIVYYFDNNGMNDYLINSFNTNKEQWEIFDNGNKKTEFEHLYCGCNLRLEKEYLNRAIMFELKQQHGSSIWFLLPDGTLILHHFSGRKVYKYTNIDMETSGSSVQFVCKKFDKYGNIISK